MYLEDTTSLPQTYTLCLEHIHSLSFETAPLSFPSKQHGDIYYEEMEGSYQLNRETNLVIVLHELSLLFSIFHKWDSLPLVQIIVIVVYHDLYDQDKSLHLLLLKRSMIQDTNSSFFLPHNMQQTLFIWLT